MATNKIEFSWGDVVIIKKTAPQIYKPGSKGCVCGIRVIDSNEDSLHFKEAIGSELYLIEFANGEALEVPKNFLSRYEPN